MISPLSINIGILDYISSGKYFKNYVNLEGQAVRACTKRTKRL